MSSRACWPRRASDTIFAVWLCSNRVLGQSCSSSVVTIQSAADATALAPCATFTGNIQISSEVTGSIALDGMRKLDGYLIATDADALTSLSADSLERVEDYVYVQRLPQLSTLGFPRLKSIGNQLRLQELPKLSTLGFDAVVTECPLFVVADTALDSIAGVDPQGVTNGFSVTNNTNLRNVTMSVNSTRLTSSSVITLAENSPELSVSFPNLVFSQNLEFSNLSSVLLPSLNTSNEIALRGNSFSTFSAPNLEYAGNGTWGMWFEACVNLIDIDLPSLVTTGGFTVFDSQNVHNITLPALETARLGFRLSGNITTLSIPSIRSVPGDFFLRTTDPTFDCAPFRAHKDAGTIAGSFTCTTSPSTSTTPTVAPSSPGIAGGGRLTTAEKAGVGVGAAGAAVVLLAGTLLALRNRRRRRSATRSPVVVAPRKSNSKRPAELQAGDVEKKELEGEGPAEMVVSPTRGAGIGELGDGKVGEKLFELQAEHGVAEMAVSPARAIGELEAEGTEKMIEMQVDRGVVAELEGDLERRG